RRGQRPDAEDLSSEAGTWKGLEPDHCRLPCPQQVDLALADRRLDQHPPDLRDRDQALARRDAVADANLPARGRADELLVDHDAWLARVHAARLDQRPHLGELFLGVMHARAQARHLRLALRHLPPRSLFLARRGELLGDVRARARQRQVGLGLVELRGRAAQLFARDEPFLHQRLELRGLLLQARDLLFGELTLRAGLEHRDRPFALRRALDGRGRLQPLPVRDLELDIQLAKFPLDAIGVALELGRTETDD